MSNGTYEDAVYGVDDLGRTILVHAKGDEITGSVATEVDAPEVDAPVKGARRSNKAVS